MLLVLIRYRVPELSLSHTHTPSGNTSKVIHTHTHTEWKAVQKIRPNTSHANSVHYSMTTTEMFTLLLIGYDPVSMAMESASLCLGIMSCECVDVMYSTGMCAHMAVITQTHTCRDAAGISCVFKIGSVTNSLTLKQQSGLWFAVFILNLSD